VSIWAENHTIVALSGSLWGGRAPTSIARKQGVIEEQIRITQLFREIDLIDQDLSFYVISGECEK
jgi:hypothetical protein